MKGRDKTHQFTNRNVLQDPIYTSKLSFLELHYKTHNEKKFDNNYMYVYKLFLIFHIVLNLHM